MSCDWSCDRSLDRRQKKNIHVKGFLLRSGDETRHDETNERNEMEVSWEAESPCRHLCRHAIQSVCVCHMNCLYTVSLLLHIKISNICKPEEGWYGQSKYCYKKTIHVVMNQLCSSLWTSRFWFIICRQIFAGHVVVFRPTRRKKNLHRMIIRLTDLRKLDNVRWIWSI